jgi:hypothetical protein
VTEVNTGLQQLLHRYDSHFLISPFVFASTPIISCARLSAREPMIPGCVVFNVTGRKPMPIHYSAGAPIMQVFFPKIFNIIPGFFRDFL